MNRAVEHITLDGDLHASAAPPEQATRPTLHCYTVPSGPEGCFTQLSVLDGHYLAVRAMGARGRALQYQFDLRFADPTPVRVRRVPWRWLVLATLIVGAGLAAAAITWPAAVATPGPGLAGGLAAACIGGIGVYIGWRWTTESLELRSVHGAAALVSVTGRLGASRRHHQMFFELSSIVTAARAARPQAKREFLRDEMREHYRLRKLGVLDEKAYDASKAAILAAH
ncbi:MAG: hypothetical protein ACT4UP_02500 [Gammaproteobacteria bacterium]